MDKKISELDELTRAKSGDILPIVDSAAPLTTKKITSINFRNTYLLPIEISNVNNLQSVLDNKVNYQSIIDGGSF